MEIIKQETNYILVFYKMAIVLDILGEVASGLFVGVFFNWLLKYDLLLFL